MECYHHIFECSHQLPPASSGWRRQFGFAMLHYVKPYNRNHYSCSPAFRLATIDLPFQYRLPTLHQGSCQRVCDKFLKVCKKDIHFPHLFCPTTQLRLSVYPKRIQNVLVGMNWIRRIAD